MNNDVSTLSTFWQLIERCRIEIPQIQRAYAHGRDSNSVKLIRDDLITRFYDALTKKNPLMLNFIYGEEREENGVMIFTPIDGQQRLTSLYLLHWYIFLRSKYTDGMSSLKNFSYLTRNSTKRFCEKICNINWDNFPERNITNFIKDYSWFSGNLSVDPTITSMLTVIDEIHEKFGKINNFTKMKEILISDNCPITFFLLQLRGFQSTNDLYIKMNARGKELTKFEIFKAKLQNSSILNEILSDGNKNNVTEEARVLYISKYNNQYADLFYKHHNNDYDDALMAFIISFVRDRYFAYVSKSRVPQKAYRGDYKVVSEMNGSLFFNFITYGLKDNNNNNYETMEFKDSVYRENEAAQVKIKALCDIDLLLERFCSKDKLSIPNNIFVDKEYPCSCCCDEEKLFLPRPMVSTLGDNAKRFALFEYLLKFKFPQTTNDVELSAYNMWKRFVDNVTINSDLEHSEDCCEALVVFKQLIEDMSSAEEKNILGVIAQSEKVTAALKYQLQEEKEKAKLMSDTNWRCAILEAETYYSDGQIGFLLEFAKCDDNNYDNNYNLNDFKKYFEISKKIFNTKKEFQYSGNNSALLEQALLCMPDETESKTAHLAKQQNSSTSWGFYCKDYSKYLANVGRDEHIKKRNMLKAVFDQLNGNDDIEQALENIIKRADFSKIDEWKQPFIKRNLLGIPIGNFRMESNCVHLAENNEVVFLLSRTTVRSHSMELNTLLLALELIENKTIAENQITLCLGATGDVFDKESPPFPLRYMLIGDTKIAYSCGNTQKPNTYVYYENHKIESMTKSEIVHRLLAKKEI